MQLHFVKREWRGEGDEGDYFDWISKDDDDGARRGADVRLDDGGCYDQLVRVLLESNMRWRCWQHRGEMMAMKKGNGVAGDDTNAVKVNTRNALFL